MGPRDGPVSIIVYSDFDCELCATYASRLEAVLERHSSEIRYTFRPFPLVQVHPRSAQAAAAFLAAPDEETAYLIHDALFARRDEWKELTPTEFESWLLNLAGELGLATDEFERRLSAADTGDRVSSWVQEAQASAIPGVPYVLINQSPYLLGAREENLEATIRLELLQARGLPPPPAQPHLEMTQFATVELSQGQLTLQLLPDVAPRAVTSFIYLAENKWYDDSVFYRVIPGQWVESGDPTGTGLGDPGYHFDRELSPEMNYDQPGMVGLVNDGPGTNGSRFFITLEPRPDLAGTATLFARVVSGLELLETLPRREPLEDLFLPPPLRIETVVIGDR